MLEILLSHMQYQWTGSSNTIRTLHFDNNSWSLQPRETDQCGIL